MNALARELAERIGQAALERLRCLGFPPGHLWEADHVVPVAEGGGGCGLEGYRTLCIPCHKAASKRLVKRLARRKKGARATTTQLVLFEN